MFSTKKKKDINKIDLKDGDKNIDNLKNPEILEVNLVKDEVVIFFDWNKNLFVSLLVFIFAGLFVFEIYLGLDYWENRENEKASIIEAQTNTIKSEVVKLTEEYKDALSFKDKSSAFSDLLKNHIYWTRFFSWIEANTLNTVKYGSFSGDLSGVYSLSATAPSFAEVSWQTKVLADNPNVKSVKVDSVASKKELPKEGEELDEASSGVSFSLELEISPNIFKKN